MNADGTFDRRLDNGMMSPEFAYEYLDIMKSANMNLGFIIEFKFNCGGLQCPVLKKPLKERISSLMSEILNEEAVGDKFTGIISIFGGLYSVEPKKEANVLQKLGNRPN